MFRMLSVLMRIDNGCHDKTPKWLYIYFDFTCYRPDVPLLGLFY